MADQANHPESLPLLEVAKSSFIDKIKDKKDIAIASCVGTLLISLIGYAIYKYSSKGTEEEK